MIPRYHADFCVTIYRIDSQDRGSRIEAFLLFTCEETKSKLPLSAEQAHVLSGNLMSGTPKNPAFTVMRVEPANNETPAV